MTLPPLRKHATTIALTVFAIAAVAALVVYDRGSVTTDEAERRKNDVLEQWNADELSEVVIEKGPQRAKLVAQPPDATGTRSFMIEIDGKRYPCDPSAVDQFLQTLEYAHVERRIAPGKVDRPKLGLDAPRIVVTLAMGKRTFRVAIGAEAPSPAEAVYGEVDDKTFVIGKDVAKALLEVDLSELRSKTIVPYVSVELEGIELDGAGGPRRLVRAPWGGARGAGFRFDGSTPDGKVRVDEGALDRILVVLARTQAETFLDAAQAQAAGTRELTLRLKPQGSLEPAVIELGGECPNHPDLVVASRRAPSPLDACVAKSVLEGLSVPAADLVDRRLIGAELDEIQEVKIDAGGRRIELARSGSGWHVRQPFDREVSADIGRDFVEAMRGVTAKTLVADAGAERSGLSPPRATVRVVALAPATGRGDAAPDAERVELLEIGAVQGDVVRVRRLEDGVIAVVPKEAAAELVPSELALRPRKVIDEPAKRFVALRLNAGGIVQSVRRNAQGGWDLVEPSGHGLSADLGLASDVADVLSTLTAERWIAPRDDGSYGLAKPRIVVEADLDGSGDAGAPTTLRIEIGASVASGGAFARREGDDAVFVAPKLLETVTSRWLVNRTSLRVDPSTILRVTVTAGSKRARFERSGEAFVAADRPPGKADGDDGGRAAAIRDALGELMAEGAASIGKPRPEERLASPELTVVIERSSGDPRTVRLAIGARDTLHGAAVRYVRRDDIDATFAVPESSLAPLVESVAR